MQILCECGRKATCCFLDCGELLTSPLAYVCCDQCNEEAKQAYEEWIKEIEANEPLICEVA